MNDQELSQLLRQAKEQTPKPSPRLAAETARVYQARFARRSFFRRHWRLTAVAAALLVAAGVLGTRPSTDVGKGEPMVLHTTTPKPTDVSLKNFQPVREFQPRVVRSIKDDKE
jgi:anti-sigma-K factor RskA